MTLATSALMVLVFGRISAPACCDVDHHFGTNEIKSHPALLAWCPDGVGRFSSAAQAGFVTRHRAAGVAVWMNSMMAAASICRSPP